MKRIASLGFGKLAILATVASVLFILVAFGQKMFSAGPLSETNRKNTMRGGVHSHAEITSCSACHVAPFSSDTMSTRCMDCHDNIREQIDGDQPMHGKLLNGEQCMSCHTEHKGPHAALTSFAKFEFDHGCTAFPLTGKHFGLDCARCHADKMYQGTPQTCVACHGEPDMHKGKFGTDCMSCHSTATWTTGGVKNTLFTSGKFNHDGTGFKLRHKHAAIDCKSCHVKENTFKGLLQSCASCHDEPKVHLGKFGTDCAQCHSSVNWKSVTLNKDTFTSVKFDHATTSFPLTGKHQKVDCKSCHTGTTFKGTSQSCVACHAEPTSHKPHPKSFGTDCKQCHTTQAWQGATLVMKHTFPMNHRAKNGKNHTCVMCHKDTIKENLVSFPPDKACPSYGTYTCYGCHAHTPQKEANRRSHQKAVAMNKLDKCASCHKNVRAGKGRAALDDAPDLQLCLTCPHAAIDHDIGILLQSLTNPERQRGDSVAPCDNLQRLPEPLVSPALRTGLAGLAEAHDIFRLMPPIADKGKDLR